MAGAAALFCWVFGAPPLIGLLFGAMVSATDPATLIPLFKEARLQRGVETTVITESVFNDPLSIVLTTLAIALLLLGAGLDPTLVSGGLWPQLAIALALVLLLRPLAVMAVLLPSRWTWRQALFVGLEGPRGVVPAALAGLPLALAATYHQPQLAHWGELLLTTTLTCIFVSVVLSSAWMGRLGRGLGVMRQK